METLCAGVAMSSFMGYFNPLSLFSSLYSPFSPDRNLSSLNSSASDKTVSCDTISAANLIET
jgi:hypothetical protein